MKNTYHLNSVATKFLAGLVCAAAAGLLSACEQEFYKEEQYRKEIYIVSGEDNIFQQEFSFGDDVVGYVSVYAGGTTPIEQEITVVLEPDEATLQDYNQKRYGESYNQYALILPESHYSVDDWSVKLHPSEDAPYSLFPIKVDINGLEPEDTYFLPLRIATVSDYMISSSKRYVLLQIFLKNDYATTLKSTYYNMNGTMQLVNKDTWETLGSLQTINSTKAVAPIAENTVRILPGAALSSDRKVLRKQGIAVTVHPDESVAVDVIGSDGLPTGETIQCQKVTVDNWYDVDGCISVLDIDDKPSYYNPEEEEFTLNYRYSYNSSYWYEVKEVMTRIDITNE